MRVIAADVNPHGGRNLAQYRPCHVDVGFNLGNQSINGSETLFVANPVDEFHQHRLAVQIHRLVKDVNFDRFWPSPEGWTSSHVADAVHGHAIDTAPNGIHTPGRPHKTSRHRDVGSGEADRPTAPIAFDDKTLDLEWTTEHAGSEFDRTGRDRRPDR
jgi:hypothetical protein